MQKRILIPSGTEMVFSKDSCGYQDVVDDFVNASFITIVTFNISANNNRLLRKIDSLEHQPRVKIITNIPNRFATYYSDAARRKAQSNIIKYMSQLNPEKFSGSVTSYFNFDNHSKIILTDNIAYIGSANFSSESNSNYETGFLIRDRTTINEINEEIITIFENESIPYHGSQVTRINVLYMNLLSKLQNLREAIHSSVFNIWDHRGADCEYYNPNLSVIDIESLYDLSYEIEDIAFINEEDQTDFEGLIESINISLVNALRELVDEDSLIYKLASFSTDDFVQEHLQENNHIAFDENLSRLAQNAMDQAGETLSDLAQLAESSVYQLEEIMEQISEYLGTSIAHLTQLQRLNDSINNT